MNILSVIFLIALNTIFVCGEGGIEEKMKTLSVIFLIALIAILAFAYGQDGSITLCQPDGFIIGRPECCKNEVNLGGSVKDGDCQEPPSPVSTPAEFTAACEDQKRKPGCCYSYISGRFSKMCRDPPGTAGSE